MPAFNEHTAESLSGLTDDLVANLLLEDLNTYEAITSPAREDKRSLMRVAKPVFREFRRRYTTSIGEANYKLIDRFNYRSAYYATNASSGSGMFMP